MATAFIYQKQPDDMEFFKYLCSLITNDARYTCEIKSRIVMVKVTFKKKSTPSATNI